MTAAIPSTYLLTRRTVHCELGPRVLAAVLDWQRVQGVQGMSRSRLLSPVSLAAGRAHAHQALVASAFSLE